ncbi:hypothetical protein ACIQNG_26250 [Streptomyces sp. NPDC091377]|uniref:hypothetical protein n=1 Tax=Streptomyces sp. NPDC091377 TaxID=3365995 RepID=UPI00382C3ADC
MTLWLKVRRAQAVLVPALVTFIVIVAVAHDQYVQLPSLLSAGGNRIFLLQLVPLVVTSALAHSLAQAVTDVEATARRNIRALDTALVVAVITAAVLACLMVGALTGSQEATMAGRNAAFLTGLMLLGRTVREQAATALPVAWVFAVMFVGYRDFDRPWPWAVTLHPGDFLPTSGFCILILAAGLALHTRAHRI